MSFQKKTFKTYLFWIGKIDFCLGEIQNFYFHFRKISKEEFVGGPSATERRKSGVGLDTDAKAELAFNVFDKNRDGYVTKNEMLKVSKNLTKEQVMLLF